MLECMRFFTCLLLIGCGGRVEESVAVEVDSGLVDTAPETPAFDCATPCAVRTTRVRDRGFCEPMLANDDAPGWNACATWCASHSSGWSAAERAAFTWCAVEDPLCFQTVDQCMSSR